MDRLLSVEETSIILGLSISTLRQRRANTESLRRIRCGRRVMYSEQDVMRFIEDRKKAAEKPRRAWPPPEVRMKNIKR